MLHSHSIKHLPAGVLLSNRLHSKVSYSWLKLLLLIAAAILAIALLGLINVAATAGDLNPTSGLAVMTGLSIQEPDCL